MSDINEMNEGLRWYVAHTYSGYENKVKANLEKIIENRGLGDLITDIRIPTETVIETDGTKPLKPVESKIFPAYVLIKMVMTDETWHVVRNIRGVTGFVGPGSKPVPLSEEEAAAIIKEDTTPTERVAFAVGDSVNIVDGVFRGYTGTLSEYNDETGEATVIVSTVGRDIPVKLDKKYVEKVKE
jgi:transcription termination/antitermination protein NusG